MTGAGKGGGSAARKRLAGERGGLGLGGIIGTAQRLESLHGHCGQEAGTSWGRGHLLVCFVVKRAGQCHISTGASWSDNGAFGSEQGKGGLSVRARWSDGGSGEMSEMSERLAVSRPSGPVLKGGVRRGQAPSGLALLHFDRPRLDCSGSLHLGGG